MEKTNEILTIAGKRVGVKHTKAFWCDECCLGDVISCYPKGPCEEYNKDDLHAYFVRAEESGERDIREKAEIIKAIIEAKGFRYTHDEMMRMTKKELLAYYKEIEGTSQEVTLIPSNEDEDEAAEMAARRAYPYEGGTKGDICEASIPIFCKGFKAGIAYERERKTQRVGEEWGDKVAENPEIIFSTDGELTVYSFVGAPRWWATIREAEEALSVFKAGICWRKAQMEKRITLIQKSWYEQGKIDGKYEGLTDDEKYQQGAFDERERMMKEAVECEIGWSDGYRIAPVNENPMNEAIAKIGVLDQVGAGVDAKVSVIIIKKEK